jgi:predicted transcriptional regulator
MDLQIVIDIFREGEWHYLPSVIQNLNLDKNKADRIFGFLAEYGFIKIGESGLNAKLEPKFKAFLDELDKLEQPK